MLKKILSTLLLMSVLSVSAIEVPMDAKLDYNQGIDFYKLGMYERSIESFRSAIRSFPDYIDAYYNLATVLEYLKQYSEALSVYKQVYTRNPNDYEVIYKMALMSSKIENYTMASEYISLIPNSSGYYKNAQELAESIKSYTNLPPQVINPPSKISTYPGIYENILSPTGVTSDSNGNLYIATFTDNTIIKITPDGKRQVFLKSSLINGPISLVSDLIGNIYVSNYNANNVVKIGKDGTTKVLVGNIEKPYGLHINGNMLFITCQGSNSVLRQKL